MPLQWLPDCTSLVLSDVHPGLDAQLKYKAVVFCCQLCNRGHTVIHAAQPSGLAATGMVPMRCELL